MNRARRLAQFVAVLGVVALLAWLLFQESVEPDSERVLRAPGEETNGATLPAPAEGATLDAQVVEAAGGEPEGQAPDKATPAVLVRGRVVDQDGRPIPQAGVLLTREREDAWQKHWTFLRVGPDAVPTHVWTDADGRFELQADELASSAQPCLVVHHGRFATLAQPCLGLQAGEMEVGDLVLQPGAELRGRVVDMGRSPLAEVDMTFSDLHGGADPNGEPGGPASSPVDEVRLLFVARRTGADGRFVATGLRALATEITATARNLRPLVLRDVSLAAGAALDLGDLVLDEGGIIAGTVVDDTGAPMPGVSVSVMRRGDVTTFDDADGLWRSSVLTDDSGAFRVTGLQPGRYDLDSHASQSVGMGRADDVGVGALDVRLIMPRYGSALLRLTDTDGSPIAGATVHATVPRQYKTVRAWSEWQFVVTQGEAADLEPGFYRVAGLGVEGAELTVRADGFVPGSVVAPPVGPVVEASIELVLRRALALEGRVVDDEGQPVAGASLDASRASVPLPASATSDEGGRFVVAGVDAGLWNLTAKAAHHAAVQLPVELPEDGLREPLQVVLTRCGTVEGVASRGGMPLVGSRVRAVLLPADVSDDDALNDAITDRAPDAPHRMRSIDTDAQGRFRFEDLSPGRCIVWFTRGEPDREWVLSWAAAGPAERPAATWTDVRPGETVVANLAQPAGARLRVQVTADGVPRAGAPLALAPAELKVGYWPFAAATGITDDLGTHEFLEVLPGKWLVVAQVPGGIVPLAVELDVSPGALQHVDLMAQGKTLRGLVVDATSGAPLAGASVIVGSDLEPESGVAARLWGRNMLGAAQSLSEAMWREVQTDGDGAFALHWLPQGDYSLTIQFPGYLDGHEQLGIFPERDDAPVRIALVPGASVEGEVRGGGLTTRQLQAGICRPGERPLHWADVEGGRFLFQGLEPGEYDVRIFAQPDMQSSIGSEHIVLATGHSYELIVRLDG